MVYTPVGRLTPADPDGLAPVTVFRHRLASGVKFLVNFTEGVVSSA
jgi:hypothetical protein